MTAIVRDASAQEFERVKSLTVEAYREYAHLLTLENWEILQKSLSKVLQIAERGQLLVACCDRELVGSVVYHPPGASELPIFEPEWASLRLLAVLPQHRGRGIGRQLSWECVERAKRDKGIAIALHTNELMVSARRMYERLGFKQESELPRHLGLCYWRYLLKINL